MLVARKYFISGRVQGVGFRYFVEAAPRPKGCTAGSGTSRTGASKCCSKAIETSVDRAEASLWRGPSGAVVDDITIEAAAPAGRATGFSIR